MRSYFKIFILLSGTLIFYQCGLAGNSGNKILQSTVIDKDKVESTDQDGDKVYVGSPSRRFRKSTYKTRPTFEDIKSDLTKCETDCRDFLNTCHGVCTTNNTKCETDCTDAKSSCDTGCSSANPQTAQCFLGCSTNERTCIQTCFTNKNICETDCNNENAECLDYQQRFRC